jgi:DNA-binding HxlR family transcriptional regulator
MALLDLLGRRWCLRIMWELHQKPQTFRGLQAACGDISPTILNTRLAELRDAGIVLSGEVGFSLTAEGERLVSELNGLQAWADRWARRNV